MKLAFDKGDVLFDIGNSLSVWKLTSGLVALEIDDTTSRTTSMTQLAIPSDVLGIEHLCGQSSLFRAVALLPCEVEVLHTQGTVSEFTLISQGYLQQQRRMQDMTRLRTGSVKSRLSHLLDLLSLDVNGVRHPVDRHQLPTMREMADIIDTAHETVCRELNHFLPTRQRKKNTGQTTIQLNTLVLA